MNNPKITVLMPVYNGEKFLREAINSILMQTFKDFEFLIINDGSADKTAHILKTYNDSRIRIINHKGNKGLISSLNEGVKLAKGKFIIRMDQDDISLPLRLEKQIGFMRDNPDTVVCGTCLKLFDSDNDNIWKVPGDFERIRCLMLFYSVIYHPTVIIRTKIFKKLNFYYDKSFSHADDYELWVRIMENFKVSNLEEVLLYRRVHQDSIGNTYNKIQVKNANKVRLYLIHKLRIFPQKKEFKIHEAISYWKFKADKKFVIGAEEWLIKLLESNKAIKIYSDLHFSKVLAEKWFLVCLNAVKFGSWTWKAFWQSSLSKYSDLTLKQKIKLKIGCLMYWNNNL